MDQLQAIIDAIRLQEGPPREMSEMSKIVLEAGRVATEKMLDYYKRMGIKVTPQMTLAPEEPKRVRRKKPLIGKTHYTHSIDQFPTRFVSAKRREAPPTDMSEMVRIGLEASRVATEEMLDYYKRMGIKVTPQMTLAPEKPKRGRRK
ncbi:hypothetical protein [Prosthecobacter sp.]|uniref:hypothetical protein n=1 Tax=Prosthecobacter sp. TaxID=1965333 RepID=UPI003783B4EA